MSISTLIAILIFLVIAVRQWLPDWLRIWHVMLAGAIAIVAIGETSPEDAFRYIDWNIIAYLFSVFSIGIALYHGGVPHRLSERLASHRHGKPAALAGLMALTGIGAAIYTNDADAVITGWLILIGKWQFNVGRVGIYDIRPASFYALALVCDHHLWELDAGSAFRVINMKVDIASTPNAAIPTVNA
jgi:hypothetical protein